MSEMIAYCGLDCAQCGAYKATVANDDALRLQTAKEWSGQFGAEIKAETINCMGCKSDIKFGHCSECNIRACGISKAVSNCAMCSDYGCLKNLEFMTMVPPVKETLENIRKTL